MLNYLLNDWQLACNVVLVCQADASVQQLQMVQQSIDHDVISGLYKPWIMHYKCIMYAFIMVFLQSASTLTLTSTINVTVDWH